MEFGTRTLDVKVRSQGMTALLFCQSLNSRVSYVWTVRKSGVLLVAAVVVNLWSNSNSIKGHRSTLSLDLFYFLVS